MVQTSLPTEPSPDGVHDSCDVLTAIEVARELRCSKAHVHNLINGRVSGIPPLPSLWLGRRRLVRRRSLDNWIAANEHGAML
jgi:hypothetical protein